MSYAAIHPDWEKPRRNMVDGYSLEMTAKELDGLREAAPLIRPNTQVAVTFLPGEEMEQRVEAAKLVRELGFEPIVHLSARRLTSKDELDSYLAKRCGVGASANVMKKYGVSLTNLIGSAGPDKLVDSLDRKLGDEHGRVRLHFYPFGALTASAEWINKYDAKHS